MTSPLSPQDVLRLRFVRDAQLSPDGRSVAYALSSTDAAGEHDLCEIRLLDLESGAERVLPAAGFASQPRWSDDGKRLAYVAGPGAQSELTIANMRGGTSRSVSVAPDTIADRPAWSPDGSKIAIVVATRPALRGDLHRITTRHFRMDGVGFTDGIHQRLCLVDVADGKMSTLIDEPGFYSNLAWDDSGERLLFLRTGNATATSRYSPQLCSVRLADRSVRRHLDDKWFLRSAQWLPGGKRIAVIGACASPVTIPPLDLWVMDEDGSNVSCRSVPVKSRVGLRFHHDMPIWSLDQRGLVIRNDGSAWVTVQDGGRAEIWELSLEGIERARRIVGGERACIALNADARTGKLLFLATDLTNPTDLYVLDGKGERRVTHVNRDVLATWPEPHVQRIEFRSPDGLGLEGWFLASSAPSQPLPTVMFIHGGPFIATGHAFRFDFHLLAAHGIGMLFANFRGSYGYGEEFAHAIVGDWGGRGFPDHMAAVDRAIELGLADAGRLGVWGHSHGGFATCWVVGHTQRFHAAVAEAAVTDIATAYYLCDAPDYRSFDIGGKPHEIPDVYRARSPLTYAHRCTTPTLLLHGENDLRCPMAGAEAFHRALLDVGCTSELVRLPNASHLGDSVGPPRTRVAQNEALLDWFRRFL